MVVLRGHEDKAIAGIDGLGPLLHVGVIVLLIRRTRNNLAGKDGDIELLELQQLVLHTVLAALGEVIDPLAYCLARRLIAGGADDDANSGHKKNLFPSTFM